MKPDLTVLIAEDNEDDAFLLQHAIRKVGLENPIRIIPNAEEVIRYLRAEGQFANREEFPFPSLMFLDIKMPGMDGFEVLRWIREHPDCQVIPTMILSSSAQPSDITRAYQCGANAYLVKPGTLSELEALLKQALEFWDACAKPPLPPKCA